MSFQQPNSDLPGVPQHGGEGPGQPVGYPMPGQQFPANQFGGPQPYGQPGQPMGPQYHQQPGGGFPYGAPQANQAGSKASSVLASLDIERVAKFGILLLGLVTLILQAGDSNASTHINLNSLRGNIGAALSLGVNTAPTILNAIYVAMALVGYNLLFKKGEIEPALVAITCGGALYTLGFLIVVEGKFSSGLTFVVTFIFVQAALALALAFKDKISAYAERSRDKKQAPQTGNFGFYPGTGQFPSQPFAAQGGYQPAPQQAQVYEPAVRYGVNNQQNQQQAGGVDPNAVQNNTAQQGASQVASSDNSNTQVSVPNSDSESATNSASSESTSSTGSAAESGEGSGGSSVANS